ncbi:MAG: carboxypeptidase-like regulatory domain-containing protein, partial [Chitinophagales bacterium]|nr:carboxypeptidase-like regulatory domain-containing protein [Chitinophagales bacterium]
MRILSLVLFLALSKTALSFTIKGVVSDSKGEALSYTNLYIKGTSNGTSANAKGEYVLTVDPGVYEIVFQHIGYQQKVQLVTVTGNTELNVVLDFVEYQKAEVSIGSKYNPADEVIKKAIARRKYFLEAVESYSCDAYVKGMNRLLDAPFWAKNRIKKAGITIGANGVIYLSESLSKLYYKKPNKFHEVVISSKVSGQPQNFTFNSAQSFFFNFYESAITIPVIASRPLISPLSNSAFFYYNYKMIGAYKEGDLLINKIQVSPKRKSDPCFTGVLSIVENNWNIHSLELFLTKDNGVQYIDTLKVTQYFIPIKDDLWLPSQQRYDAKASYLGIKGDGYFFGSFKNYQLNNLFEIQQKVDSAKNVYVAKSKNVNPNTVEKKQ